MRKELLFTLLLTVLAVATVLGAVKLFAPQLLGGPRDLGLVQLSREAPSFFGTVFGDEEIKAAGAGDGMLLLDPVVQKRARNFAADEGGWGPNDALGFRNLAVPNSAEVLTIGDSQTYGNNAALSGNWPSVMRDALRARRPALTHYDLSTGGWGAVQYLAMFRHAKVFNPRLVVVAFYSGNDPLESFSLAYGVERWKDLRVDQAVKAADTPKVAFPPPPEQKWAVSFAGGVKTIFTPELRLSSNDRTNAAVDAGWKVMLEAARRIATEARAQGVTPLFTVVPSKELVYAKRVASEGLEMRPAYRTLVELEARNIAELAESLKGQTATYIDVVTPLQRAAMGSLMLYPDDENGHPIAAGYQVIGEAIAHAVEDVLPPPPRGLVALMSEDKKSYKLFVATAEGLWLVGDTALLEKNGWDPAATVTSAEASALIGLPVRGLLAEVDPKRFGPGATTAPDSGR